MKKLGLSFMGALLLAFAIFSSCSLSQQSSSISFCLPSDTSVRLSAFRDLEEASNETPFYVSFNATGDWQQSVTKNYAKLEELNDCKFEFEDLKSGSNITVTVELGYNQTCYYKGESQVNLVTGVNLVAIKLELVAAISDFTVSASYTSKPETVYDGTIPFALVDDTLTFTTNNTYDGEISWKINNQAFDGTINPVTTELKINLIGKNTVEYTVTDKVFNKITKTVAFEFGFEALPESLTLSLEKQTTPENSLIYGTKYPLLIAEQKSLPAAAKLKWTLNDVEIAVKDFVFDSLVCDSLTKDTKYTLAVAVTYGSWTATGSFDFVISFVDGTINLSKAVPDFKIKCSDSAIYIVDSDVTFELEETTSQLLNVGTEYTWYLNGGAINNSDARTITVNFSKNDYVKLGPNKISVKATYNGTIETRTFAFNIFEPAVPLFGKSGNEKGWKLNDQVFSEEEYLDSFCYDADHNIYIAVRTSEMSSTIKKCTYNPNNNSYGDPVIIAVVSYPGQYFARMTTDGNHIYGVLSTSVPNMKFESPNIFCTTTEEGREISEEAFSNYILSLSEDFSAVSALVYNDGKLYVGGVDKEIESSEEKSIFSKFDGENCIEETKNVVSNKYIIRSYPIYIDGTLNTLSSTIEKTINDSEIVEKHDSLQAITAPETTNIKIYYQYQLNTIISDLAIFNNNVYALVNSYSNNGYVYYSTLDNSYTTEYYGSNNAYFYKSGIRVYTDLYNLTNSEEDFTVGVASQSEYSSSNEVATRFLAIKPKEFVLAVNGGYDGTKVKDVNTKKKSVSLRSLTGNYCFDELVSASGYELKGTTHLYKVITQDITE